MTEVFHFLPSYQPFERHCLVGSHQGVVKVTNMTPNASHCEEEAASHILQYIRILTYYYTYMYSGDIILYRTIVIACVTHWYTLTACWQFLYTTFPYVLTFSTVMYEFYMH